MADLLGAAIGLGAGVAASFGGKKEKRRTRKAIQAHTAMQKELGEK